MITISPRQFHAVQAAMLADSRRRVASFLRDQAPDEVGGVSEAELASRVETCERSGLANGLASERAQALWALLVITTDRAIEQEPFPGHLRDPFYATPDDALYALFDAMVDEEAADPGSR